MKVNLFGARGRVGRLVADELLKQYYISSVTGIETRGHKDISNIYNGIRIVSDYSRYPMAHIWIDFSTPRAAIRHADAASKKCLPIIIGTTGFSTEQIEKLKSFGSKCPLLLSSNFSTGIGVMQQIVGSASRLVQDSFEVSIAEQHHNKKVDKPSGTAKYLIERIKDNSKSEPQVSSFRLGGAIGEHQVRFVGDHEELVITHRAFSRRAFSQGVVNAVNFIIKQEVGFYTIHDIYNSEQK